MNPGQLLLTEEEWRKRENSEGKLLLTRDEWLKRTSKEGNRGSGEHRVRDGNRGRIDRTKVRCFNCQAYGHFAADCQKPCKEKDVQKEVNLSQIQEDEPTLLIDEVGTMDSEMMFLKEEQWSQGC